MKTYVKPDLVYEDFELNATVATGCRDSLNHTETDCSIEVPGLGLNIFSSNCDVPNSTFEDYCEFTGKGDDILLVVFTS